MTFYVDVVAQSLITALEISEHAPAYHNKRAKLIDYVVNSIATELDEVDAKAFIDVTTMQLNENRKWIRIGEYLKLPQAIEKDLNYHALYYAARKGYVNAREDEEGWLIEEISFNAWLRVFPYGAYAGNG